MLEHIAHILHIGNVPFSDIRRKIECPGKRGRHAFDIGGIPVRNVLCKTLIAIKQEVHILDLRNIPSLDGGMIEGLVEGKCCIEFGYLASIGDIDGRQRQKIGCPGKSERASQSDGAKRHDFDEFARIFIRHFGKPIGRRPTVIQTLDLDVVLAGRAVHVLHVRRGTCPVDFFGAVPPVECEITSGQVAEAIFAVHHDKIVLLRDQSDGFIWLLGFPHGFKRIRGTAAIVSADIGKPLIGRHALAVVGTSGGALVPDKAVAKTVVFPRRTVAVTMFFAIALREGLVSILEMVEIAVRDTFVVGIASIDARLGTRGRTRTVFVA